MASRVVRSIERILRQLKNRSLTASIDRSIDRTSVKHREHASHSHRTDDRHRTRVTHRKHANQSINQTIDINELPWFEDGSGDEALINSYQPPIDYFYLPDRDGLEHLNQLSQTQDISQSPANLDAQQSINQSVSQSINQPILTDSEDHSHCLSIDTSWRSFDDDEDVDADRMHLLFGLALIPLVKLDSVSEDGEDDEEDGSNVSMSSQSGYQSTNSASSSPADSPQLSPYIPSLNSSYSPSSHCTSTSYSSSLSSNSFTQSPVQSSSRCDTSSDSENELSERTKRLRSRFERSHSFSHSAVGEVDREIAETIMHNMLADAVTLDGELEVTSEIMRDLDSWRFLGSFLTKTPSVSSLKLKGVRIGLAEVKALGQGALHFLRHLELSDNHLNDETIVHAVKLVVAASTIQTLRVERNGVKSVDPFAKLIQTDMQLVHLSLAYNAIDGSGAVLLANAIRRHARSDRASILSTVDVQCNAISPVGVEALRQVEREVREASPDNPFYVETGGQRPQAHRQQPPTLINNINSPLLHAWKNLSRWALPQSVRARAENLVGPMPYLRFPLSNLAPRE